MRFLLFVPTIAATAALAAPLAAQQPGQPTAQSPAIAYDQTAPITLEGTADTMSFSGTQSKLVLQPTTGTQMWDIALPNTNTLLKKGLSANNLARGTPLKVSAYKAKDAACTPNCKAQGVDLTLNSDGKTYDLLSPVAPDPAPPAGGSGPGGGRGRRGG